MVYDIEYGFCMHGGVTYLQLLLFKARIGRLCRLSGISSRSSIS
jgi:hypothetical protein